jgi:hypothetical protein
VSNFNKNLKSLPMTICRHHILASRDERIRCLRLDGRIDSDVFHVLDDSNRGEWGELAYIGWLNQFLDGLELQ